MKAKYTLAFKQQAVQKALSRSDEVSLRSITDQLGVGYSTMEQWIRLSKAQKLESTTPYTDKMASRMTTERKPQDWSLEQRLEMIMACASLDQDTVSQRCREQGIYPHHLAQWKTDFIGSARTVQQLTPSDELKKLRKENKSLKHDLSRKDKALAETAALLVLQKKAHAIWGIGEAN